MMKFSRRPPCTSYNKKKRRQTNIALLSRGTIDNHLNQNFNYKNKIFFAVILAALNPSVKPPRRPEMSYLRCIRNEIAKWSDYCMARRRKEKETVRCGQEGVGSYHSEGGRASKL